MTTLSPYPNSKNTMSSIVNSSAHPLVINDAMKRKVVESQTDEKKQIDDQKTADYYEN